jgi:hypothetical protein
MQLFIIEASRGEWSDRGNWTVGAYTDEEEAKRIIEEKSAESREAHQLYLDWMKLYNDCDAENKWEVTEAKYGPCPDEDDITTYYMSKPLTLNTWMPDIWDAKRAAYFAHLAEEGEEVMGRSLDDVLASLPEDRRLRVETRAQELVDEVESLGALRWPLGEAQIDIASALNMKQPSVSKPDLSGKR